jgi:translocation and assembly module TamB
MTTDSFQAYTRARVVAELERITGGRVELGSLHTTPLRLRAEFRDLTIHGREHADEAPYVQVKRLVAELKIVSLVEAQLGFDSILIDRPSVHIIIYPDGSTNQPEPKRAYSSNRDAVEQLFSMSITHLDVRHGTLLWNDQEIPLDFAAQDVSAQMSYSFLHRKYNGSFLVGKTDTRFKTYRPIAWTAECQFIAGINSADVTSCKASSGHSQVQLSGHVDDFRHLKLNGNYELSLDLAEAAAFLREPAVRRGSLQASGQESWSAQEFKLAGKLLLKDVDWRAEPAGIRNAGMDTQFALDPKRLTLSQINVRAFGGSMSGDAEISGWQNSLRSERPAKQAHEEEAGVIHLRLQDLSVSEIAAAFSTPARPFYRVKLAGAASGTVDTKWKDSWRKAESSIAVAVTPFAHVSRDQLPLSAKLQGAYRPFAGELSIAELSASTRATQVQASGTLSSSAALKLSVNTSDLGEWQPILTAAGYAEPLPVNVRGHASFTGTATGRLSDIAFAGNLQSENFDVLLPATTQTPARQIHWDALAADVQLSPHVFAVRNGALHRGRGVINFDLRAGLQERQFTDSSPFALHLDVQNGSLTDILTTAGYDYPASGTLTLHAQSQGTRADLHGDGRLQLTNAIIHGEAFESITADLRFNGQEVEFQNIQLTQNGARVVGAASYDFANQGFRFHLSGTNFDLAHIAGLQRSRVLVEGRMDFTADGSGTLQQPAANVAVHVRDLTLDHERAGDFDLNTVSQGPELHVTGQSHFEQAELQLDGNVLLRDEWPAKLSLHLNHLDVDSFLRTYLRGQITGHSAAAGDVQVDGPLRQPHQLQITANLSDFYGDVENIKVRNDSPLRFSISRELLKVEQFHLTGEGTDIAATGTAQLTGDRRLDLRAQGSLNLKLIESFNPDFTSSGIVTVDMSVSGTAAKPVTEGRVRIDNASIAYIDLPSALSDLNGTLVFNQDRLQIETLTARTGGGLVSFTGYATTSNGQLNFNLGVQGEDVRLRYPPGISSTADADLHFVGTPSASTLSGEITVNKLAMTPGFDFGAYLQRSAQISALPTTNPLLNRIRLDVHIETTPELQMQSAILRLSGDADLHLRGTAAKPVIIGRADIIEGEVYFQGTKYRMERGDISFTDPVSTKPVLDLQASTHIRDYDITMTLNGPVERPSVTYRSEPPLPTSDIIALLAFGQTSEESARIQQSSGSTFSPETSTAILTAALNATLSSRAQRLFGVSRIKIDPQGLATETSPTQTGPAVTIEQQVKNNLTLTYTTNVSQASQQIIQIEYNVTRNVSIVGVRDQNGVVSFDIRIRQRKR